MQTQYIDYTASDDEDDEYVPAAYPVAPITYENNNKIASYGNICYYGSQLVVPKVTFSSYYQIFKKPVPIVNPCCPCASPKHSATSVSAKIDSASGACLDHRVRGAACAAVTVCTIKGSPPIECVREEICYEPIRMPSIYKSYRCRRRPRRPKLLAEYVEVLDSSKPKKCWLYRCMSPTDVYDCLNTKTRRRSNQHHQAAANRQHHRHSVHRSKYADHDFVSDFNSTTCASSNSSHISSSKCSSSLFSSSNSSNPKEKQRKLARASELPGFCNEDQHFERLERIRDQYSSSITSLQNHNHKAEYLDDRSFSTAKHEHRRSKASSKGFRLCNDDSELRRNR